MLNVIPEELLFSLKKNFFPKIFWLGDFRCSISRSHKCLCQSAAHF